MTILYSLLDEVQDATLSGSTKRQVRALTRITDLFLAGSARYSKQQMDLFDEVFKILVAAIELKTRARLATRLANDQSAPATLVRAFAFDDEVSVAAPVLSHSTTLGETDLVTVARTQSQGHLYAIAQRKIIDATITEILIQRGDIRVVRAVVRNVGAKVSANGFRELVELSSGDSELALDVGSRRDIPRFYFLKLLEIASASVCSKIVAAHPQFSDAVPVAVTDVVDELNQDIRGKSAQHARAKKKVNRRKYWNELGEHDVQVAARAQDFERVVTALSILARCPIEIVERAALSANPGAVQVVAKAAECSWATVRTILLMRAADRILSKMDLDRAREHFERLETTTAKRVLAFYETRRNGGTDTGVVNRANAAFASSEA
jgi:uncharacterized protein (DUF2336 family)